MSERLILRLLAAALFIPATGAALAENSWCQHDDPAYVERIRREQGISNRDVGKKVACPTIQDPESYPDELVLPMPCGRRMVFRRVDFALEHMLDHVSAYLGSVPEETSSESGISGILASVNGPWRAAVAGSLSSSAGDVVHKHYYLGKYEVTELQFGLLRDGLLEPGVASERGDDPACGKHLEEAAGRRGTRVLPAVDLSWLDAVTFAHRYSAWLVARDRERIEAGELPLSLWKESSPGYLRLPTEVEWEFAARAGIADSSRQSQRFYEVVDQEGGRTWPELEQIAFLNTSQTPPPEDSDVDYVGRRMPNVLGLYDMVGNADEIVFDLFRPLRPDALGGQRGGYVLKGGNALEGGATVGVGHRQEASFFDRQGPRRSSLTGFRVLYSAPVFVNKRGGTHAEELFGNPEQNEAFKNARLALLEGASSSEARQHGQILIEFEQLRSGHEDEKQHLETSLEAERTRFAALETRLQEADSDRAELEDLRALLAETRAELERIRQERSAQQVKADALADRLGVIQTELERGAAELNSRDRQIRREQMLSAVFMFANINSVAKRIFASETLITELEEEVRDEEDRAYRDRVMQATAEARDKVKRLRYANRANFDHYVNMIVALADDEQSALDSAGREVSRYVESRGLEIFETAQRGVITHVADAAAAGGAVSQVRMEQWRQRIEEAESF